jgi:hypothetical protein
MKTYTKVTPVTAEQFKPTTAEKESLTKEKGKSYSPAVLWGDTLKKRTDGEKEIFYLATPGPGERILIEDGQWLVKESESKWYVVTDEDFKAKYTEAKEEVEAKEDEDEDPTGALLN